jgi:hypothetical protein
MVVHMMAMAIAMAMSGGQKFFCLRGLWDLFRLRLLGVGDSLGLSKSRTACRRQGTLPYLTSTYITLDSIRRRYLVWCSGYS